MLILDTDHLTAIDRANVLGLKLRSRLEGQQDEFPTTIVSIGEQLRGLNALIASARSDSQIIEHYGRLSKKLDTMHGLQILPWTHDAMSNFHELRRARIRIGTMDLRIASIALTHDATLLSRNLRDFTKIPGLRVEDWLR